MTSSSLSDISVKVQVEMVVETPGNLIEPWVSGTITPDAMAIPRWIMQRIVGVIVTGEHR